MAGTRLAGADDTPNSVSRRERAGKECIVRTERGLRTGSIGAMGWVMILIGLIVLALIIFAIVGLVVSGQ